MYLSPDELADVEVVGRYDSWLECTIPDQYHWKGESRFIAITETFLQDSLLNITDAGRFLLGPYRMQLIGKDAPHGIVYAEQRYHYIEPKEGQGEN